MEDRKEIEEKGHRWRWEKKIEIGIPENALLPVLVLYIQQNSALLIYRHPWGFLSQQPPFLRLLFLLLLFFCHFCPIYCALFIDRTYAGAIDVIIFSHRRLRGLMISTKTPTDHDTRHSTLYSINTVYIYCYDVLLYKRIRLLYQRYCVHRTRRAEKDSVDWKLLVSRLLIRKRLYNCAEHRAHAVAAVAD